MNSELFYCCPVCNQGTYQKPIVMHYWILWELFIFIPHPLHPPPQDKVRLAQGQLQSCTPGATKDSVCCSRTLQQGRCLLLWPEATVLFTLLKRKTKKRQKNKVTACFMLIRLYRAEHKASRLGRKKVSERRQSIMHTICSVLLMNSTL